MATKTAVCPECGAAAGPGRYACAECGALLAAVGTMPRSWPTTSTTGAEQTVEATASAETAAASGTPSASSPSGNGIAKRPRRTKAPAGDPGTAPLPPVRTPAGAYLAPSAVLPPLDAPASARNGQVGTGHDHDPAVRTKPDRPSRVSLTDTLDAFGLTPGMPRRLVGV